MKEPIYLCFCPFLKLPMDRPSPDHSTFSRFRKRFSKDAMIKINSELLLQFNQQDLPINEGIAVDARLVKSAFKPISKEKIEKLKQESETPEGKLDKNGQPKKYTRDIESDWTIKNEKPHYGLKEPAAVGEGLSSLRIFQFLAFICLKMELHWRSNPIGKVQNNLPRLKNMIVFKLNVQLFLFLYGSIKHSLI